MAERLSHLRMRLIGVACTNPKAVGYRYAQEKGVFTTRDYRDLYHLKELNMIIEVTGRREIANEISRTKPEHVRFMDHAAARLFWDVFQTDEALRESEEKYSTLVESSLTGIYIDQDRKIVFANEQFARIYGYDKDELIGMDSRRLVHPKDRAFTDAMREKRLRGNGSPSKYEARGLTKDGKTIWVARRNTRIDYEGRPAILGNIVDVTERRRMEEELRESEERSRTIFNNMQAGVLIIDEGSHVIVDANPVAAGIIGTSRKEIIGKVCHEYVCPEKAGQCPISDLGQEVHNCDCLLLTAGGKGVPILKTVAAVSLNGRKHLLESFLDITELKRIEEQLRDSQERYYTVLEACPDPVVVYDMNGRGLYINPAFTRVFGWTPGEVLGMKLYYVPEEHWPETKMMIDKVLMGESFFDFESRRYTKNGKIIDVSISAAVYTDAEGVPAGSVHIIRDITQRRWAEKALQEAHDRLEQRVKERTAELAEITEQLKLELIQRKRVEQALRQAHKELAIEADELQSANEELSQYAYIVSHDLKAPLRAVRNYADFLYEDLQATLNGDQKTYLDGLKRAVRQGTELVEDLLEFSRVGRLSMPTQTVDVGIFLQELIASLALSPDVEVVIKGNWPTIDTDPTLLREIFQDLIRNAVKFNHASHKRVEIGWLPAGEERYELFVRDNGIGIDPRYHQQIFGVFQRLHTREEYEGTGVGLAIVKKAANKLQGSVRVESKIGEGSTFFVALPKTQRGK
ncbi:MAG: PAS domain S-box protein [Deltaproteobacteria bacterium]|nr:PAS domain S-box protein [Deltaproteobacteria bacterium]